MNNKLLCDKFKENIIILIENNKLSQAKELIYQYKKLNNDDVEIYSIEAVILIMEGDFEEAKIVIDQGLEKNPFNEDLLFNMSYLMDKNHNLKKSVEYYAKGKLFNSKSSVKLENIISNYNNKYHETPKVLFGTMEIANQMNTISSELKKLNIDTKTLDYYPNYLGYKSDYVLNINNFDNIEQANLQTKRLASKLISENDIFHFMFGTSLVLDYSDLNVIKELDKKMIMHYFGTDARLFSKFIKTNKYGVVKDYDEDKIKRRLEFLSEKIPYCIACDPELYWEVKDYHQNAYYIPVTVDVNKYKYNNTANLKKGKPLIIHSPTHREFKGTKYILSAIEKLRLKYDFDFKLIENVTHAQAMELYGQADIIIDQVLAGAYGTLAIECMAMGKPVVAWVSDFCKEKFPSELPVVSANPDNLYEKLEYMLKNQDMFYDLGVRGRKYVEEYHDISKIGTKIVDIYKRLLNGK